MPPLFLLDEKTIFFPSFEKTGKASSIVVVAEGDKTGKNVFELASYVEKNLPDYLGVKKFKYGEIESENKSRNGPAQTCVRLAA